MATKPQIDEPALRSILEARAFDDAQLVRRAKLRLASLASAIAPPFARNLLELAERFERGEVGVTELDEGRVEAWTYLGSLACYCSETDSLSVQVTMTALNESELDREALFGMGERLRRAGLSEESIFGTLTGLLS